jgi:hypothetical protein
MKVLANAKENIPGPFCVILYLAPYIVLEGWNDNLLLQYQQLLAMASISGAQAVVLPPFGVIGEHQCRDLMNMAH